MTISVVPVLTTKLCVQQNGVVHLTHIDPTIIGRPPNQVLLPQLNVLVLQGIALGNELVSQQDLLPVQVHF